MSATTPRLRDRTALVTGAGSGLGEAIAQRFAAEGARVVVVDVDEAGGERVVEDIRHAGQGNAFYVRADVTRSADWARAVSAALEHTGRLDIVVNNAGINQPLGPMLDVGEALFKRLFDVNVKSIFLSAHHAVPVMRRQGGGVIINNASIAGIRPRAGQVWYSSLKAAAVGMTKAMAVELGADRIRVNALCPVITPTPLVARNLTPEREARVVQEIPLGRLGRPSDSANAALFLACDEGVFITGVALEVDGGRSI